MNNSTEKDIDFTIQLPKGFLNSLQWDEDEHIDGIEKFFKLTTTKGLSLKNMHMYNNKGQIQKYNNYVVRTSITPANANRRRSRRLRRRRQLRRKARPCPRLQGARRRAQSVVDLKKK